MESLEPAERQRMLEQAMEMAGLGVWSWSIPEDEVRWSRTLYEIYGLEREAFTASYEAYLALVHPDDRERVRSVIEETVTSGTRFEQEERIVRPDGEERILSTRGEVKRDEDGRPVRLVGICQDVTEQHRARRRMAESDLLETLHRIGASVAAELDPHRIETVVLEEAARLTDAGFGVFCQLNYEGEDRYVLFNLPNAEQAGFADCGLVRKNQIFRRTFDEGRVVRCADVRTHRDIAGLPLEHLPLRSYLAVPLRDAGGAPAGGLFFGHREPDHFTARHERLVVGIAGWATVALSNARLYQEAHRAVAARDNVLAVVSHDLRSPLNAISAGVDLCLRSNVDPAQRNRALEAVRRAAGRARLLVEDLLDVTSAEGGGLKLDPSQQRMGRVLDAILEDHRFAAEEKGVTLGRSSDEVEELECRLDLDRVCQALGNLVVNAIKFTPPGGAVTVRGRRRSDAVEIQVADTGVGIPPDQQARVFDRFWHARQQGRSGAGLGLAIAKGIVEGHGGRIELESTPGQGTVFSVTLPLDGPDAEVSAADDLEDTPVPPGPATRVLFVDDDPDIRELAAMVLANTGMVVDQAARTTDAIRLLETRPYSAVITDLTLAEGQSGLELTRHCRRVWPDLAVYVVTGDPDARRDAMEVGATAVLLKPVDFEALGNHLQSVT